MPHCICLLRKEQCKKLSSYILPKESRRLSLCVILYFIFFTSHYSVLVLLQILLFEGKKDTTQMSIHFQPSRICSSFVKGINLAESQEVSSRTGVRPGFHSAPWWIHLVPLKDSHLENVKLLSRKFTHLVVIFHKTYEKRTLSHLDIALMQSKLRKN